MTDPQDHRPSADIAVVGLAAHLPGAPTVDAFWANLCAGVESIQPIRREVLRAAGVSEQLLAHPAYIRSGSELADIDCFDAGFFGFSPKDAAITDPQQRHFLECAWEALENAGYTPGNCPGPVSVFAGSGPNSYLFYNVLSDAALVERDGMFALRHTGNDKDVLATRVSFQMNFRGLSVNVQTACSTSLTAVHLACQSLLNHECEVALAGAVTIELPHCSGYLYREAEVLARDGHCRAFDADSSGTVYGSGAAIVVLRRLSDALTDRDTIHAVIKGTALNNDGSRKVGFLSPSVEGQADVIAEALAVAGIAPESVGYVEAHGTGTAIGDPIELTALGQVYGVSTRRAPLWVGSVKTNIGHLDTAAGAAGLIKAILAVKNGRIPPTVHFRRPNPRVDFEALRLRVNDGLVEWDTPDGSPRRAGVTSLGIGGTNAHVVLEQPPAPVVERASERVTGHREWKILTVSAKTKTSLDNAIDRLAAFLRRQDAPALGDVAHTLHVGRVGFPLRRAIVCRASADAVAALEGRDARHVVSGGTDGHVRRVAFLCTGQGSQYVGMGHSLYQRERTFRYWLDSIAELARAHVGSDLRDIIYPAPARASEAARQIRETCYTQAILFAVEYAMARQWIAWGVTPQALLGHSIGEFVAAALSGVFTLEDTVAIVCARGQLMQSADRGSMLAIARPARDLETLLNGAFRSALSLAAVNAPDQCVVSGATAAVEAVERRLAEAGIPSHRLATSHAFHSSSMDPILDRFREAVAARPRQPPKVPIVSNVTGTWLSDQEAIDPEYWVRHVRQTVRFGEGVETLVSQRNVVLLEVGPGDILAGLARQHPARTSRQRVVASLPRANAAETETETLATAVGSLWVEGVAIDWPAYDAGIGHRRVPVPAYAFERQRHWLGPRNAPSLVHSDLRTIGSWFQGPAWEQTAPMPEGTPDGSWLLVGDGGGAAAAVADTLRARGVAVTQVRAGRELTRHAPESYELDLGNPAHWEMLVDDIAARGALPTTVVHLCALDRGGSAEDRCFFSLLWLVRAIRARDVSRHLEIGAVSSGSVRVQGELVTDPDGALLDGVVGVAPKEYTDTDCRHIDIQVRDPLALSALVIDELSQASGERVVAYRDGQRWVRRIRPITLDVARVRPRERGVYLVTGGLGDLGLACADWLARAFSARLVLVSRGATQRAEHHRAQFSEWERLGAEVLVSDADVTDQAAMARAVAAARQRFGSLNGVVHAAGTLADGAIALKDRATAEAVLAPKVTGWRVLDALTRQDALDFVALFSSISAVSPPAGQADYCAANAYLIAAAHSVPAERSVIAIGWGAWGEIGMAARNGTITRDRPWQHPFFTECRTEADGTRVYAGALSLERHWVVDEHRFRGGDALLPGTAYLDLATAATRHAGAPQHGVELRDVMFAAPFVVRPGVQQTAVCRMQRSDGGYRFTVADGAAMFATGVCRPLSGSAPRLDIEAVRRRCTRGRRRWPQNVRQAGHIEFGPRWRTVKHIALGDGECLARLEVAAQFREEVAHFMLHPALLDMATGVAFWLVPGADRAGDAMLPFAYKQVRVYRQLPAAVVSHARTRSTGTGNVVTFDVTIATPSGEVVAEVEGFSVRRLTDGGAELSQTSPEAAAMVRAAIDNDRAADRSNLTPPTYRIRTQDGLEALRHILNAQPVGVAFVSPADLGSAGVSDAREPSGTESVGRTARRVPHGTNGAGPHPSMSGRGRSDGDDEIERELRGIWQRLLGIDDVEADSDFFDAGGHSLHAVRLFTEIRKTFGVELGLSTVFEARTLGAQARHIRAARAPASGSQLPERAWPRGIVPIQPRGTGRPLFLVHDVGGTVLGYAELARHLDADLPVFGIEARGFLESVPEHDLEQMAKHYVDLLRAVQPTGPYHIVGHSFGGLAAYEMARQLRAAGETVGLVGVIDTFQRGGPEASRTAGAGRGFVPVHQRLGHHIRTLLLGPDRVEYIRGRLAHRVEQTTRLAYRTAYALARKSKAGLPRFLRNVEQANWIATDAYQPRYYAGVITLFRCGTQSEWDIPDPHMGWGRLVDRVEVRVVPGDHLSMMKEPHVRVLARELCAMVVDGGTTPTDMALGAPADEEVASDEHSRYQRA